LCIASNPKHVHNWADIYFDFLKLIEKCALERQRMAIETFMIASLGYLLFKQMRGRMPADKVKNKNRWTSNNRVKTHDKAIKNIRI
jgi:hypothetical protein